MKSTRHITEYSRTFEIFPFVGEQTRITVNQSKNGTDGEWLRATINWPALGSVSVHQAREFANGIQYATAIANLLNQGQIPSA